ncbi:hypothetical protein [Micromonospora chokoriensis]
MFGRLRRYYRVGADAVGAGLTAVELARVAAAVELGEGSVAVARHEAAVRRYGRWSPRSRAPDAPTTIAELALGLGLV